MPSLHQVAIAADQQLNTLLGGWADETLSARCYRLAERDRRTGVKTRWTYAEAFVNFLFIPQDWLVKKRGWGTKARHCERAYGSELLRLHYPEEYRERNSK